MLLHHEALFRTSSLPHPFLSRSRSITSAALSLALILVIINLHVERVRAQTASTPDADEILRVRTDLVTVPLFVTNGSGHRVSGLTEADFGAQVDGRPLKLEYFAAGTECVALAFALDASGSAREIISRQSEAALRLFSRFGPQSRVAVWHFGTRPQLVSDFTASTERAQAAFNLKAVADERTAIFDAAAAAVRAFERPGGDSPERRILILISDGLDTASRTSAQAVIGEAQQRAVSIYVIHLPLFAPRDGRLQPRSPAKGFRALAEETGGRFFTIGDARTALDARAAVDLNPVFTAIEEDLHGQYVLGFYMDDASRDNRSHRLSITLTAHRNRQLRVRQLRQEYILKK